MLTLMTEITIGIKWFWEQLFFSTSQIFICSLLKVVFILIAVAYFTIAERKVMAAIQRRKGPNVVGFWGLLQPLADGAKLAFKELLIPTRANATIFLIAPIMVLILSMISWSIIPSGLIIESATPIVNKVLFEFEDLQKNFVSQSSSTVDINYGVLFLLAVSGLNVYGIIIAGWASNSKYAFLGALRSAAQMISYEVSLGILILPVILFAGSLNLTEIVAAQERTVWFFLPLLPCAIMFFISMLAETNRAPFDLPEAEAELVAGYNVEYSSIIFAMFFLGEYSNMLLMATVIVLFFFGGWLAPLTFLSFIPGSIFFSFKIVFFCYLFILVRAAFPRYRYDQLMNIGWKVFLPISLSYLVFITGILVAFDATPQVLEIQPQVYKEAFFSLIKMLTLNLTVWTIKIYSLWETQLSSEVFFNIVKLGQISETPLWVDYIFLFYLLFLIGLTGMMFNYKNYLVTMFCIELMYLGITVCFVIVSISTADPKGQIYAILLLVLAAAESAIGLGVLIVLYRFGASIEFQDYQQLKG